MCCAVRCVATLPKPNPKTRNAQDLQRSRERVERVERRAAARALERKPKSLKIYNTQTAYESLEGPQHTHTQICRQSDRRRRVGGTATATATVTVEELRLSVQRNIRSEDREKMVWNVVLTRSTHLPFFNVCVSGCACVCPCCRYLCIQATRPLTGKITSEERAARRRCLCCCGCCCSDLKRKSSVR